MTPADYTKWVVTQDLYPQNQYSTAFYALGLTGEAGEVAEKVKKLYRDGTSLGGGDALVKELGDVLWYLTRIAEKCGYTLQDVIEKNVAKLSDRNRRGVSRGSGDNR
jgi:NTP pyrophosphatase (non-canonical NTP hydrolase)